MNALQVSYSDIEGGAARAAYRLHRALLDSGVDSRMLVRRKSSDDWTVQSSRRRSVVDPLRVRVEGSLTRLQHSQSPILHSANLLPTRWSSEINKVGAEIVNLHWIGAGALSVEDVARIRRPVVMTLHDMWAFCGAEHLASTDEEARWRVGYRGDNRVRGDRGADLDRWTWQRKRRRWRRTPVVCPSRWLADCVTESALMRDWPVHVIPNALDTEIFRPGDRALARRAFGLPERGRAILFSAMGGTSDEHKGWSLLADALRALSSHSHDLFGIVVGQREPQTPPQLGFPLHWLGHLSDDVALSIAYAAANVVVVPSKQEALSQVATEAQACGVPVVAFSATGLRDVVVHEDTGYLACPFDARDLARGIAWVLDDETRWARLSSASRDRAVRLWAPSPVAAQYLDVYERAIADHRESGAAAARN